MFLRIALDDDDCRAHETRYFSQNRPLWRCRLASLFMQTAGSLSPDMVVAILADGGKVTVSALYAVEILGC